MVELVLPLHDIDLVVMDAKEFLDRMDQQRMQPISCSLEEHEEENEDEKEDADEIHRDSVCVSVFSFC